MNPSIDVIILIQAVNKVFVKTTDEIIFKESKLPPSFPIAQSEENTINK